MANLDHEQRLCFAILAVCDALEERDDTKASESLKRARKHAHAILSRYGTNDGEGVLPSPDGTTPADVAAQAEEKE